MCRKSLMLTCPIMFSANNGAREHVTSRHCIDCIELVISFAMFLLNATSPSRSSRVRRGPAIQVVGTSSQNHFMRGTCAMRERTEMSKSSFCPVPFSWAGPGPRGGGKCFGCILLPCRPAAERLVCQMVGPRSGRFSCLSRSPHAHASGLATHVMST